MADERLSDEKLAGIKSAADATRGWLQIDCVLVAELVDELVAVRSALRSLVDAIDADDGDLNTRYAAIYHRAAEARGLLDGLSETPEGAQ